MQDDLAAAMDAVKASGRQIILVSAVPTYATSVPDTMLRRQRIGIDSVPTKSLAEHLGDPWRLRQGALDVAARFGAVTLLSEDIFCPEGLCIAEMDGKPLYFDDDHLSVVGSGLLARRLDAILGPMLEGSADQD